MPPAWDNHGLSSSQPDEAEEPEDTGPAKRPFKHLMRHRQRRIGKIALAEMIDGEIDVVLHAVCH